MSAIMSVAAVNLYMYAEKVYMPAYCLQNYDRCILAIQEEDGVPQPSAWDC